MTDRLASSLADYLPPLAERLTPGIVEADALDRVRLLAADLPAAISAFFGFEIPLAPGERDMDFLCCSTRTEGHAAVLAGQHRSIAIAPERCRGPAWAKVTELCRRWEDPGSPLHERLLNIWLEFDTGSGNAPHHPSLFFGPTPAVSAMPPEAAALIVDTLGSLTPAALDGARGATLRRVLGELPEGVHVFQAGAMLSREMPAVRLCLRGIDAPDIVPTLARLGWRGDRGGLIRVVEAYADTCLRIDVDIDVGVEIGDKIGLECSFGRDLDTPSRIARHAERLLADGLLDRERADALLAYNGLVHEDTHPQRWSEPLKVLAALQGPGIVNALACWVHHVKLVWQSDAPLAAKAYLAVQAERLPREALRRVAALGDC